MEKLYPHLSPFSVGNTRPPLPPDSELDRATLRFLAALLRHHRESFSSDWKGFLNCVRLCQDRIAPLRSSTELPGRTGEYYVLLSLLCVLLPMLEARGAEAEPLAEEYQEFAKAAFENTCLPVLIHRTHPQQSCSD